MNAASCRILLRPRGPFETFDLTLLFMRQNGVAFARLAVFTLVPLLLPMTVLSWVFDGHWALLFLLVPFLDVVQIPFTVVGARLLFADEVPLSVGFGALWSRGTVALLVIRALTPVFLLLSLGMGLLVVPAWHFLPETLLVEKVGFLQAQRRSQRLGAREPLTVMVGVVSRALLTVWMGWVVEGTAQAVIGTGLQLGSPLGAVTDHQVTPFFVLGVLLAQPLHAVYRLLLYIDARTLAEGWDLQVALWSAREARR